MAAPTSSLRDATRSLLKRRGTTNANHSEAGKADNLRTERI